VSDFKATIFLSERQSQFLFCFLIAALLPYFLLTFYIHPVADDFDAALRGGVNFWENQVRYYMEWNGRYSANLFVFFTYLFVKVPLLYRLFPAVLIISIILVVYSLIQNVYGSNLQKGWKGVLSLLIVFLFLNGMPSQAEGLYWFTGSVTYIFPFIILVLYLNLTIQYFRSKIWINRICHTGIIFVLLIFLCGFNEVLTLLILVLHFLFAILSIRSKYEKKNFAILLFALSLIGMIIVATAPGNAIRSANFPGRHLFVHSSLYSLMQTIRFTTVWVLTPAFWLTSLLYLPLARQFQFANARIHPLISTFVLLLIVFCAAFPAYWSTGILGQHRTINAAYFLFLLYWFLNLHLIVKFIPESFFEILRTRIFITLSGTLLVFAFFITGNSRTSWSDLFSGRAKQFDAELTAREEKLIQCKAEGLLTCKISALSVRPKSIFVLDIQQDSTHFINVDYSIYYGLNSVSLKK
jgi:hypothetical protein